MAKYRHRIFEMYDFREEAILALTPKSVNTLTDGTALESLTLRQLSVARSAVVTHVTFKEATTFDDQSVNELREDLAKLAEMLVRDSKVLFDFAGVVSFGSASFDALVLFNKMLKIKGSRIALCCLAPTVRESFFAAT
jgi:anti-anti-sigma regulatory factor